MGCTTPSNQSASSYNFPSFSRGADEGAGYIPPMELRPIEELTNPIGFHCGNIQQITNPAENTYFTDILNNLANYNRGILAEFAVFYYSPMKDFSIALYPPKNKKSAAPIFTSWGIAPIKELVHPQGFKYQNFVTHEYSWDGYRYACILKNMYTKRGNFPLAYNAPAARGVIQSDFPLTYNSPVETFIQYFQNKENFMKAALGRAKKYRPLMTSIFRANEIPEDLVYLSLIESGFNTHAYSSAGACGPWQLMKGTAKQYGLRVDKWVDERRDPEKSTKAAVKYLKNLYAMFGDWYLALTAYNAGEGKVSEAIQRYNSTDLWYLREKTYLKQESCDFVPKLLAAITIGKQPAEYGFAQCDPSVPTPSLTKVNIPFSTDLKKIAAMTEISLDELKRYNPELCSTRTPPDKQGYWIKIPESKEEIFVKNFSQNKDKLRKSSLVKETASGKTNVKSSKKTKTSVKKSQPQKKTDCRKNCIKVEKTVTRSPKIRFQRKTDHEK